MVLAIWAFTTLCSALAVERGIKLNARYENTVTLPFQVSRSSRHPLNSGPNSGDGPEGDEVMHITHDGFVYTSLIYLGSNNQPLLVQVDTGSSDLFVPAWDVQCAESSECKEGGTFNSSSSTSFKDLHNHYKIGYLDGTHSEGEYGTDSLSFNADGSNGVQDLQFGVANVSANNLPILGIGLKDLEATRNSTPRYDNLPIILKNQGFIQKVAYLVYLNDSNAKTGNILFGAYDKAKVEGDLVSLPITSPNRLNVDLESMSFNGQDFGSKTSVSLDTGASIISLKSEAFDALGKALGANLTTNKFYGKHFTVECDKFEDQNLSFNFNGLTIEVPFTDLLKKTGSGTNTCALLVLENKYITSLGDNFLRHAYLLYNLEEKTISIGKIKYTDDTDIQTL